MNVSCVAELPTSPLPVTDDFVKLNVGPTFVQGPAHLLKARTQLHNWLGIALRQLHSVDTCHHYPTLTWYLLPIKRIPCPACQLDHSLSATRCYGPYCRVYDVPQRPGLPAGASPCSFRPRGIVGIPCAGCCSNPSGTKDPERVAEEYRESGGQDSSASGPDTNVSVRFEE